MEEKVRVWKNVKEMMGTDERGTWVGRVDTSDMVKLNDVNSLIESLSELYEIVSSQCCEVSIKDYSKVTNAASLLDMWQTQDLKGGEK